MRERADQHSNSSVMSQSLLMKSCNHSNTAWPTFSQLHLQKLAVGNVLSHTDLHLAGLASHEGALDAINSTMGYL